MSPKRPYPTPVKNKTRRSIPPQTKYQNFGMILKDELLINALQI